MRISLRAMTADERRELVRWSAAALSSAAAACVSAASVGFARSPTLACGRRGLALLAAGLVLQGLAHLVGRLDVEQES